jgi:cell division septum initiation protein DivIVA
MIKLKKDIPASGIEVDQLNAAVELARVMTDNERLRQRVAELEDSLAGKRKALAESRALYAQHRDCCKQRGDRMKSMREWIENDPEDNGGVSFVQRHSAHNWFDPETGEPL